MNNMTSCATCGGTGASLSRRSWFTEDGFKRSRCAICGGTGQAQRGFIPDSGYVAFQAKAREWAPATSAWVESICELVRGRTAA